MMHLELDKFDEWEIAQKITVEFLQDTIKMEQDFDNREVAIKSYLFVLSDHMYIGDFKKYAKENDLEDYCKEIYEYYED